METCSLYSVTAGTLTTLDWTVLDTGDMDGGGVGGTQSTSSELSFHYNAIFSCNGRTVGLCVV